MYKNNHLMKYIDKYKKEIIIGLVVAILLNGITALFIYNLKNLIDKYIPRQDLRAIYLYCVYLLIMLIAQFVLSKMYTKYSTKIAAKLQYDIRNDIFQNMLKIKYENFSSKNFGEMNTKIIQDVEVLIEALFSRFVPSLSQIIYCGIAFALLFYTNLYLALSVLGFITVFSILIMQLKKAMVKYTDRYASVRSDLNIKINELVESVKIINIYQLEDMYINELQIKNFEVNDNWLKMNIFRPLIQSSIEIATLITYILTFIPGRKYIMSGTMTMGELLLFVSYLPQIWSRYSSVIDIFSAVVNIKIFSERVFESFILVGDGMDENWEPVVSNTKNNKMSSVIIKDIVYSYANGNGKPIYEGFTAKFTEPGLYAIVGESGCGKSTLFNLILRFYTLTSGQICVNDVNINDYSIPQLRSIIGIVHQEPCIINGTLVDNIRFGDKTILDSDVEQILREYGLEHFFDFIDNIHESTFNYKSKKITLGQMRIISILRVLIRNPEILLFDEITTSLDSYTETRIHLILKKVATTKICLFISHKHSDIEIAKKITYMQKIKCNLK